MDNTNENEDDILSGFLGLDLRKLQEVKLDNDIKAKPLAVAIVKLTEYPEWPIFMAELDRMEKSVDRPCEHYAGRPQDAWSDVGMKRAIDTIKRFIKKQELNIEKYAKDKETTDVRTKKTKGKVRSKNDSSKT